MRYYGSLLIGVTVAALLLTVLIRQDAPPADTVSSSPAVVGVCPNVVERLDATGAVIETYESVDLRYGPVGILAFVTTDGRRLFLERGQWRVR